MRSKVTLDDGRKYRFEASLVAGEYIWTVYRGHGLSGEKLAQGVAPILAVAASKAVTFISNHKE